MNLPQPDSGPDSNINSPYSVMSKVDNILFYFITLSTTLTWFKIKFTTGVEQREARFRT
jgi:hypothetical protein